MGYHDVISTILAFVIPLVWFGLFLLLFRLICKLKWLTAVCLAVIAGTAPSLLGVSLFAQLSPMKGLIFFMCSLWGFCFRILKQV